MEDGEDFDMEDDEDFESEEDFEEEPIMESKKRVMNKIVENVIKTIIKEDELHAFGKHPGYQKKPMELPSTGEDKNKWGEDWNDESVYSEEPFGTKIGDSTPYDKVVNAVTKKVIDKLSESISKKKRK